MMSTEKKRIMDVARPGKTAASATARPIIVGHGPIIKDPMVQPSVDSEEAAATPKKDYVNETVASKLVVQPPKANADIQKADDDKSSASAEPENANNVAKDQAATETDPGPDEQPQAEASAIEAHEEEAIVDAVASQAVKDKKGEQQAKEETERLAAQQKLIDDKKYFLPISRATRRRNARAWIALLILLLMTGAVYVLLDAKIIQNNLPLPFELFKEKVAPASAAPSPTAKTSPVPNPTPSPATTAPSLTSFTNTSLGLSFAYPDTWGTAKVTTQKGSISGTAAAITFSKKPLVTAGLLSKDYKEDGRDGSCYILLGIFPETSLDTIKSDLNEGDGDNNTATYKRTVRVLDTAADRLAYEQFEAGQAEGLGACSGASAIGYKAAAKGAAYTGVQFFMGTDANKNEQGIPVSEFDKYKANPNGYINDIDRQAFVAVLKSAQFTTP
jgi:hypothetical protein